MTLECRPPASVLSVPNFDVPAGACDCHVHIFGPYNRFPLDVDRSYTSPELPLEALFAMHDRLGIERAVLVLPTPYGTDNSSVIDALERHPDRLRAVVVLDSNVSDDQLDRLTSLGARGVRVNLLKAHGAAKFRNGISLEELQLLAPRLAERGWHAQIFVSVTDLPEIEERLLSLGLPLVFDHMGRPPRPDQLDSAGLHIIQRLLVEGRAWCKLSAADRNSVTGPPFEDVAGLAGSLIGANPDRVVWGSDWPHVAYFDKDTPDDGILLGLLSNWIPDAALRKQILVDNPARLYGW